MQACDSNYISLKQIQIIETLVANFVKPMMPRQSMTLSRHQDKLLQTPATLETLGSTSAVPLHRLEAWKAACVNSWIHRHGAACGKEFVSELSCQNHACRTTAEQRQLSLLASSRFQDKQSELFATNSKKIDFDRSVLPELKLKMKNETLSCVIMPESKILHRFFYIMLALSVASS